MAATQMPTDANPPRAVSQTGPYWQAFARMDKAARGPAWLRIARNAGIAHFVERGFPTLQDEDWRFTNITPVASLPFVPVIAPTRDGLSARWLRGLSCAGLSGPRLVFVNGHLAPNLSDMTTLPAGVRVMSLAAALASDTAVAKEHLFHLAHAAANAFTALNNAFFQDGAFIHLPAGQRVPEPIQLLHLATATAEGATAHLRHLIVAEAGAEATVIENFASLGAVTYVTNTVTELVAGAHARIEHVRLQDESQHAFHLATLAARFNSTANVAAHSLALGARLSRCNIHAHLAGTGVECLLNGLYLTRGEQLADHFMTVEHASPHCASHEYFNGVLTDRSKGVFHGRIHVHPAAQKTDAKQTNRNLLLSNDATVTSKPQLEIYADDVRCTHGATVGQLNDEAIFYLRSRAIGLATARQMLIHAFAGEIIGRVRCLPLRAELDRLVWDRLEQLPAVAVRNHPPLPSCLTN